MKFNILLHMISRHAGMHDMEDEGKNCANEAKLSCRYFSCRGDEGNELNE